MSYSVKGKLHKKFNSENKSGKFETRDFVIVTSEQYPQYIKFQLFKTDISKIDQFNEGQEIEVHFNIRGREYNDSYFTNLQAWKVN